MKKIAIIMERANITLGGAERSVFELAAALSAGELDVHILAAKGHTNADKIHILCRKQSGKRMNFFTFDKVLREHIAENDYDIVHSTLPFAFADVYQPRGGSYIEAALRNAAGYRNNFLQLYKKSTSFVNYRRTVLMRAEKKLCQNPGGPRIAALSDYVARQFKKHYKLDESRLVVIPNGVRINKPADKKATERLRGQILFQAGLKESDNPFFFLFVANNFRLKGLAVLIEALYLSQTQYGLKNGYLIVAGNGRTAKYRRIAKKLGVENKIIFLGSIRNVQNVLSISDVAVLPTFYDPSSRFILETLAAGKPVITTKFNGATDLFTDNRHGKVIDCPENIIALSEAIVYFSNRENIKKASQAIIEDNLKEKVSIGRAAKKLTCLYESILKESQEEDRR